MSLVVLLLPRQGSPSARPCPPCSGGLCLLSPQDRGQVRAPLQAVRAVREGASQSGRLHPRQEVGLQAVGSARGRPAGGPSVDWVRCSRQTHLRPSYASFLFRKITSLLGVTGDQRQVFGVVSVCPPLSRVKDKMGCLHRAEAAASL